MADGKYATYEHTLRVGNEVVLLSEQEQASTGRGWDESAEERMGVGQVKDFVEVMTWQNKNARLVIMTLLLYWSIRLLWV